jgi:CBS domain-containing protein
VSEIVTPAGKLTVVNPEEDAADALNKLAQRDVGQLPVTRGSELVGLFRRQDLVKWLQLHSEVARS